MNTNNLTILATGTDMVDGLKRFIKSCEIHNLNYKIMGLGEKWQGGDMKKGPGGGHKINLLINTLIKMTDNEIVLVSDSYDVIMASNSNEILEKYYKFNKPIIFATESICWPDSEKEVYFPLVRNRSNIFLNSGGFIGTVGSIKYILKNIDNKSDDQRWYIDVFLSDFGKKYISLDYNCEIFQCLNDAEKELEIVYNKSRVKNKITDSYPCHIHGNGGIDRKIVLNRLGNYLMNENIQYSKYNKNNLIKDNFHIYINIKKTTNSDIVIKVLNMIKLNLIKVLEIYPNIKLTIDSDNKDTNISMQKALENNVDYFWLVDTNYVITYENTLLNLILANKGIITPLMRKENDLWSNFWGDISQDGWYKDSFDYIDIVNNKKQGCWNVPFISGNILINKEYLKKVQNFFKKKYNANHTLYMTFCNNCRNNNIFMYIDNTYNNYGYIVNK
jgi:hypothetical protein